MGRTACAAVFFLLVLASEQAWPEPLDLHIDRVRSAVTLTPASEIRIDFGSGPVILPLEPAGAGAGATLPNGMVSDGLTTFVEGTLRIDLKAGTVQLLGDGTLVDAGVSGEWSPGEADLNTPSPADLATSFGDVDSALRGEVALRWAAFSLVSAPQPLTETAPGSDVSSLPAALKLRLLTGFVNLTTNLPGLNGRAPLRNAPQQNRAAVATLERLAGGRVRLTLPLDVLIRLDNSDLPDELLFTAAIDLVLQGQIVATGPNLCGDVNDDGGIDAGDVAAFRVALAEPIGSPLSAAGQRRCTVIGTLRPCDLLDLVVIRRIVEGPDLAPGIAAVCEGALEP